MGALVGTRLGRYFLVVVALGAAILAFEPSWISGGMPIPQVRGRAHRPPAHLRNGMTITLTAGWPAGRKPYGLAWAISDAVEVVHAERLPDVPPQFTQTMIYNPQAKYEISEDGLAPLYCKVLIDGQEVDDDETPVNKAGARVRGNVHCWINPT